MDGTDAPNLQLSRRARDYWRADGLPLLIGAIIYLVVWGLVVGVTYLLFTSSHTWFLESLVKPLVGFAFITSPLWGIGALIWLSVNWEDVVEWFKIRLTYPRTGYAAPPSYWESQSSPPATPTTATPSLLCRSLIFLGGFWFWLLVGFLLHNPFWNLQSPKVKGGELAILLIIRGLRFRLYSEADTVESTGAVGVRIRVWRFARAVLNSFWVWVFLLSVLPEPTPAVRPWLMTGAALFVVLFVVPALAKATSIGRTGLSLCGALCAVLLWTDKSQAIVLAILLPGFYAAAVGGLRLFRYLRTNPAVPS